MKEKNNPLSKEEMKQFIEIYKSKTFIQKLALKKLIAYLYCVISLRCKSNNH